MIEKIKAQDAHVLAVLARYRSAVVKEKPSGSNPFIQLPLLDNEARVELTPAQYNAIGLELPYA